MPIGNSSIRPDLGLFAAVGLWAWSTAAAAETLPMVFDHITVENGLSQGTVMDVLQDSQGFVWFATEDGLNRWDGYEIRQYTRDRNDPSTLGSDFIWDIEEDAGNDLWLATKGGGVVRWDRETDSFRGYLHDDEDPNSLSSNTIRALLIQSDGRIWVGTRGGGVDILDPASDRVERLITGNDSASQSVFALAHDATGNVLVGTDAGLYRFTLDGRQIAHFRHDPNDPTSLSDNRIRSLFLDRDGTAWIGTQRGGLNGFDLATGEFVHYRHDAADPTSLSSDHVRVVYEDDRKRLWLGTQDGLNLLDRTTGTFTRYYEDTADYRSLSDSHVVAIYQDRGGIIWFGTREGGANRWNPRSWSLGHHKPDWIADVGATSFADDGEGNVWVGTPGAGVARLNLGTGELRRYRMNAESGPRLSDDRVMSLLLDSRRALWIGTMTGGLNRLDTSSGELTVFRADDGPGALSADGIMSLLEDRTGTLWVGTFGGGVCALRPEAIGFECHAHDPDDPASLSSPRATAIAEDGLGGLWVATDGGGLNYFDRSTGGFRHFRHDPDKHDSLSTDQIYALHVDRGGTLWVGTAGGGLDRAVVSSFGLDDLRFDNVSRLDGLSSDVIYGIVSDDRGNLWLSSNNGLMRYDPRSGSVKSFHRNHGLQGDEFNFGASHRGPDGRVYFGGPNGINAFYPSAIEESRQAPPLVLTLIETQGRPAQTGVPYPLVDAVELGYDDDVVTFEFAALDFTAPEKNQYAYRLEGFDRDWNLLGNRRRVTYTNLDAANYVFRVRAANSDGVWNNDGLAIPLRVVAAPWDTSWAYGLYAAFGILLVASLFRVQQRRLAREAENSRRLESMVDERTTELAQRNRDLHDMSQAKSAFLARMSHEIRTPMNGVMGMTELLRRTALTSPQRRFADTIQSSATSLLALVNDILDFSKIEAGKLDLDEAEFDFTQLLEETVDLLSVSAFAKDVELLCQVPTGLPTLRGDALRVRQILTNLIGNAVKYTEQGEIFVRVAATPLTEGRMELRVEVRDTGVGISADELPTIFDPFAQADNAATGQSGTGLGLSISRQLVEMMHGEIGVESIDGAGSNFWFTLPFEIRESPAATQDSADVAGASVLVVTNRRSTREALQNKLSAWGAELVHVAGRDDLDRLLAAGLERRIDMLIIDADHTLDALLPVIRKHRSGALSRPVRIAAMAPPTLLEECENLVPSLLDKVLRKPVREEPLRDFVFQVAERQEPAVGADSRPCVAGRVLVAEDNVVNQAVARGMLREIGCEVVIADNGRAALDRVACEEFDLVLMDCQMPVMDGFQATALIRQRESSGQRLPIVALTANALAGERERCLEAGMDDYLSKPFTYSELADLVARNIRSYRRDETPQRQHGDPLVDRSCLEAIRAVGDSDDDALLAEIIELFVPNSGELINELRQAVDASDSPAVQAIAHNLKSSSYHVGARRLGELCQRIEDAGGRDDIPAARELVQQAAAMQPLVVQELEGILSRAAA